MDSMSIQRIKYVFFSAQYLLQAFRVPSGKPGFHQEGRYCTKIEGLSPATVYGVATFYAQFSLEPKGRFEIKVCDGTACHVRGSMPVLNAIKARLDLKDGKMTTEDGMFSLETVSCLGACGLAPVVVINGKVYPQMTSDAITIVLDTLLKEDR